MDTWRLKLSKGMFTPDVCVCVNVNVKRQEWVQTHSVRLCLRFHWCNVKLWRWRWRKRRRKRQVWTYLNNQPLPSAQWFWYHSGIGMPLPCQRTTDSTGSFCIVDFCGYGSFSITDLRHVKMYKSKCRNTKAVLWNALKVKHGIT